MSTAQPATCANCAHWKPSDEIKPQGSTIHGWCLRYPPTVFSDDLERWPSTDDYERCGEFKPFQKTTDT